MSGRIIFSSILRHSPPVAYKIFPRIHTDLQLARTCPRIYASATSLLSTTSPKQFTISGEDPIFQDLLAPNQQCILMGIDPDANGAIAVLHWTNPSSLISATPEHLTAAARLEVIDMPTEIWKLKAREKKQPSPEAFLALIQQIKAEHPNAKIRATIEFTTPGPLSGKYAWYGSGFATGLITGLFLSQGIPYEKISAAGWKRSLGLIKLGKEGSLTLAKQIFPQAADVYLK